MTQKLNDQERLALYYRVRERVEASGADDSAGGCFYYTYYGMLELARVGINACVQAGSLNWPIVEPDRVDEVHHTHFGYVWSPDTSQSKLAVELGHLPECHIWIGVVETQELIDFAIHGLPISLRRNLPGVRWETSKPSLYYWGSPEGVPDRVHYTCEPEACVYVGTLMKKMLQEGKL